MKMKTVRVLFSINVDVPIKNPNTLKEGPGPYLFGSLQEPVEEVLSNVLAHAANEDKLIQKWKLGSFELYSVELQESCSCCDGSGCPTCDPCVEDCKGTNKHTHYKKE